VEKELERLSEAVHRCFMCVVLQIRFHGDVIELRAIDDFKVEFLRFAKRRMTFELHMSLRHVGKKLRSLQSSMFESTGDDAIALNKEYETCVDRVCALMSKNALMQSL